MADKARQTVELSKDLGTNGKTAWSALVKCVRAADKAKAKVYLAIAAVWVACHKDNIWITGKAVAKATGHSEGYVSSIKTGIANYMDKMNVKPDDALQAINKAKSAREFLAEYTKQSRGGGTGGKGKNTGQGRKTSPDKALITQDSNDENRSTVNAVSVNQVHDAFRQLKPRLARLLPAMTKDQRDDMEILVLEIHGMFADPAYASPHKKKGNGKSAKPLPEQDGATAAAQA